MSVCRRARLREPCPNPSVRRVRLVSESLDKSENKSSQPNLVVSAFGCIRAVAREPSARHNANRSEPRSCTAVLRRPKPTRHRTLRCSPYESSRRGCARPTLQAEASRSLTVRINIRGRVSRCPSKRSPSEEANCYIW